MVRRITNSIRLNGMASLRTKDEAQTARGTARKCAPLTGSVQKRAHEPCGGWRRNDGMASHRKQGDPDGTVNRQGVRASIVVMKRGNARGAKGRRNSETSEAWGGTTPVRSAGNGYTRWRRRGRCHPNHTLLVCLSPYENREAGWATMPLTNAAVGHHYTTVALNDESHGATELESRMREIRQSGSEGGGVQPNALSLPLSGAIGAARHYYKE